MAMVLGIDPGSRRAGWGIVEETSGVLRLIDCGVIDATIVNRAASSRDPASFSYRLAYIYGELCQILGRYETQCAAIEQVFTSQNIMSALKLGQARGVAVAACAAYGLEIYDYEPTLVKKSLVGVGRADKNQVAFMVKRLLNVMSAKWPMDTTDALAVAICHLSQRRFTDMAKKSGANR